MRAGAPGGRDIRIAVERLTSHTDSRVPEEIDWGSSITSGQGGRDCNCPARASPIKVGDFNGVPKYVPRQEHSGNTAGARMEGSESTPYFFPGYDSGSTKTQRYPGKSSLATTLIGVVCPHSALLIMAAIMAPTPPSLAIMPDISSFAASVRRAQHAWRCSLASPGNACFADIIIVP